MTATKYARFNCSAEESRIILRIVDRAEQLSKLHGFDFDRMTTSMDITAAHCNGCELNLSKLVAAPAEDFIHDVFGIRRHIDRKTGEIGGCFLPRCTAHD